MVVLVLISDRAGLAEAALGEGTGVKLHKLSVKELKDVSGLGLPVGATLTCCMNSAVRHVQDERSRQFQCPD